MATKTKGKTKRKKAKASKVASKKTSTAKKTVVKKSAVKKKAAKRTVAPRKAKSKLVARKKTVRKTREIVGLDALEPKRPRGRSGRQAGDLQGLSRVQGADSESVADLLEEGNTFEAEAVAGVEAADLDNGEVRSHEVLEDDVPEEYLEKD